MHKVYGRNGIAIRSFENHYEASGYALHFTACSGSPTLMLADPESEQVSLTAVRDQGWNVTVERFGTAADADRAFSRLLARERGSNSTAEEAFAKVH